MSKGPLFIKIHVHSKNKNMMKSINANRNLNQIWQNKVYVWMIVSSVSFHYSPYFSVFEIFHKHLTQKVSLSLVISSFTYPKSSNYGVFFEVQLTYNIIPVSGVQCNDLIFVYIGKWPPLITIHHTKLFFLW